MAGTNHSWSTSQARNLIEPNAIHAKGDLGIQPASSQNSHFSFKFVPFPTPPLPKADLLYHHLNCWTAPLLPSLWTKQVDSSWTFPERLYVDSCKHGKHCAPVSRPEESWGQEHGGLYLSCQGVGRPQGLRRMRWFLSQYGPNSSETDWLFQAQ